MTSQFEHSSNPAEDAPARLIKMRRHSYDPDSTMEVVLVQRKALPSGSTPDDDVYVLAPKGKRIWIGSVGKYQGRITTKIKGTRLSRTGARRTLWSINFPGDHRTCSQSEAVEFIERTHYALGAPNTSVARHVLIHRDEPDKIRGVALWLPPTRRAAESVSKAPRGVLALSRFCLDDDVPGNGESFLLGASMRMLDRTVWHTLLTYADTRHGHTGTIYRATNWVYLGTVPGSDAWADSNGMQRGRKRGRRNMSVAEMKEAGFTRLPASQKHKFVHYTKQSRRDAK